MAYPGIVTSNDPRYSGAADGIAQGQGRLGRTDVPEHMLPKTVVDDIFTRVAQEAPLLSLGQQIPVSMNETVIRYSGTNPEAGQVGAGTGLADREGAVKPISGFAFGSEKSFSPIKIATIVTVSEEFLTTNPEGLYTELSGKLSGAIGRAAELAVFHNRNALTGGALSGTANNSSVVAGLDPSHILPLDLNQNLVEQLLDGVDLIHADPAKVFELTAFAAHPSFRTALLRARDAQGNLALTNGAGGLEVTQGTVNLRAQIANLLGLPLAFGRSVSGAVGNYAGTDVRLVAGDFSQMAYGFADGIRIKVSNEATVGGVSMFQTNQVAILAEATFGWYVNDNDAFVAWEPVSVS